MRKMMLGVLCLICIGLASCSGASAEGTVPEGEAGQDTAQDLYSGVYCDYDVNEPSLVIQKNDDGTYEIQIGIYRLAYMEDGVGNITEHGMEFTATAPNGNQVNGIITLEGDIATVVFDSGEWSEYADKSEYQYYRTWENTAE